MIVAMTQNRLIDLLRHVFKSKYFPILIVAIAVSASFIFGWYFDTSHPMPKKRWEISHRYTAVAKAFAHGDLPKAQYMHYTSGYPLLGAVGYHIYPSDPFSFVAYGLLLGSAIFCFLAVRQLLN